MDTDTTETAQLSDPFKMVRIKTDFLHELNPDRYTTQIGIKETASGFYVQHLPSELGM